MEENEVESGSTESDVSQSPSSEGSESNSSGGESPAQAAAPKQTEPTPFHEHPRFKELVEQKNSYAKEIESAKAQIQAFQKELSSLKESQPKPATETDALIADLKKIDPRLANVIESQLKAAQESQTIKARLEAFEKQSQEAARSQQVQTAVSKINQMHDTNKASPEVRQFVNDKLDLMYMQGKLNLQNLDQAYKEQYDAIKKYEDSLTRQIRESYVKEKTKDASVPASVPKGTQAKPAPKALNAPKGKDELKAAVVKSFLKESVAAREATNN